MSARLKVAIIGASGYTGLELLKLLFRHPHAEIVAITSRSHVGQPMSKIFPRFSGHPGTNLTYIEPDMDAVEAAGATVAFMALPHGMAAEYAIPLIEKGIKVIDLSADFRLRDAAVYEDFYGCPHPAPEYLEEAVYGMPEIHGAELKNARLIASPGCYPTSTILPLVPLLRDGLLDPETITVSSMSGVSGAGRKADISLIFAEVNESVRSYGLPRHRHLPEIEQELSLAAGEKVVISFAPHLIPVTAGICTTTFAKLRGKFPEIGESLQKAYANSPFIRLRGEGVSPDTKNVVGTNYIDIGWHHDERTNRLILQSTEDNLGKGAGGQAVQAFNLISGLDETDGLLNL